ncbi:MAG: hypothetical protein ACLRFL_00275 [Clostridia bacterium]
MEKLYDTSKSIHDKVLKKMFSYLKNEKIDKIIDAGSGKTSASILLKYFPSAKVDAVVYPGDNRKKNPLENSIGSDRLDIIEADICNTTFRRQYDLCLAHLTLGEAHNFGNHFSDLFHKLMDIKSKHFVIMDILEDPAVHFRYIEQYLKEKGFKVLKKKIFKNPNPEHYPKVKYDKYKLEFDSKHYIAYLIEKIENK